MSEEKQIEEKKKYCVCLKCYKLNCDLRSTEKQYCDFKTDAVQKKNIWYGERSENGKRRDN